MMGNRPIAVKACCKLKQLAFTSTNATLPGAVEELAIRG
jgi:hypothetical protein